MTSAPSYLNQPLLFVLQTYFLPGLVALGVVVGAIAAATYNQDASVFITPANSEGEVLVGVMDEDRGGIVKASP